MEDWSEAIVWIVLIVSVLIYNLVKLYKTGDPKEELLKLKKLKDEGIIEDGDFENAKKKLLKKISE